METGRQAECKELIRKTTNGVNISGSIVWSFSALVARVGTMYCLLISNLGKKKTLTHYWYPNDTVVVGNRSIPPFT